METYTRTITPDKGDPFEVTLRPLMAGDRADIQDAVRVEVTDEDGDGTDVKVNMGQSMMLTVARAIVRWTRSELLSETAVRNLPPDVFDKIKEHVAWGYVPAEPEPDETPSGPSSASSAELDGEQHAAAV